MNRDDNTLRANFRIIVFAYSNLQGLFAFHNLRLQLKHTQFSKYSLEIVKEQLQIIKPLFDIIKTGNTIFGLEDNNFQEKQNLSEVRTTLGKLKVLLTELSNEIENILSSSLYYSEPDKLADAVAGLSFKAYSRDNYARCHLEIEDQLRNDGALKMFQDLAAATKLETKQVHDILNTLKNSSSITADFYEYIRFFARTSPALMRCNVHDINQFMVYAKEDFNYVNGDFSREEEQEWNVAGFGSIEAGYWRACSFNPQEAIEWSREGISDPLAAYDWKAAGYPSTEAYPWASLGYTPYLALQWVPTRLPPQLCLGLINKGYGHPSQLPSGEDLQNLVRSMLPKPSQS